MRNKVVVTIGGRDYTMVAVEDEEYVRQCAQHVDQQLKQISSGHLSLADAAVLAAMNIADEYFKEQQAGENLEEANRLKLELSEAMRLIFKLCTRKLRKVGAAVGGPVFR